MIKEHQQFYIHGRRQVIMYDGIASGLFSAVISDLICSSLGVYYNNTSLYITALVLSFLLSLIYCRKVEKEIYLERTYTPPKKKYLGEMFLDEYSDEQLFEDIKNDKTLQEAIERSKKTNKKK